MREIQKARMGSCDSPIADIKVDTKPRDDVSPLLLGLQPIHGEGKLRQRLFDLLDEHITCPSQCLNCTSAG